jgi:hypothetical protein
MSQSEVTRESYPGLFALRDALRRRGIASEPRAFDQYQGPYLMVPGAGRAWYADSYLTGAGPMAFWVDGLDVAGRKLRRVDLFTIDSGASYAATFETKGAGSVIPTDDKHVEHGIYTLRQAAKRIAEVVK